MKINKIISKGESLINEDQLLIKDNLYAVFDGAASLNKFVNSDGKTGGFLASSIAKNVFSLGDKSLLKYADLSNKKIWQEMKKNNIDISKKENLWFTGFAAVKIKSNILEWAQISDCLILLINKNNSFKLLIKNYDHDQEIMIKWKKLGNISKKEKWNYLFKDIINLRKKQNINYGVLNGEKNYAKFIKTGTLSLNNVKHIIIFTDGLIPLKENPRSRDKFDKLIKNFLNGGLGLVKDKVREAENKDPECQKFPRYKKHDDIAAISITL